MKKSILVGGFACLFVAAVWAVDAAAQGPYVSAPVSAIVSPAFRDLPVGTPEPGPAREINRRRLPPGQVVGTAPSSIPPDPLVDRGVNANARTPSFELSFDGQGNSCGGCSPPDPIGAVGASHYVQLVNATSMQIFNKSGTSVSGPSNFALLWPVGQPCRGANGGDPVVVYDYLASRWLLAQFSPGNGVCVAVSQTNNPTGAYNLYQFTTDAADFPDYYKFGVWPDAYYMSSNETNYAVYAFDRTNMLAGAAASFQKFTAADSRFTNFHLPATVVGATPPAAGAPGIFYTFKDGTFHGGVDRLEMYHFHVDWATPALSTFTLAQSLPVTAFTYTVCGFFEFHCVPQPGTVQTVDAISEWPMWQLQYRNFGGTDERLVANFTIPVAGPPLRAGIRWYQINKTGAVYSIAQEGTFSPDNDYRWMGSIGMDQNGDIALGYSVSSSTNTFPSLRYATRAPGDLAGSLQTEVSLVAGAGSQTGDNTNNSPNDNNRWGDYSAMTVDPDGCHFWFTGEYYATSSATGYKTRIGKFHMPNCTTPVALMSFIAE